MRQMDTDEDKKLIAKAKEGKMEAFEGLSYNKISQTLNILYGIVMSRLNRARKKLKNLLSQHF